MYTGDPKVYESDMAQREVRVSETYVVKQWDLCKFYVERDRALKCVGHKSSNFEHPLQSYIEGKEA